MIQVVVENNFESWRNAARNLLAADIAPDDVVWMSGNQKLLFEPATITPAQKRVFSIKADFIKMARSVACHTSAEKWPLLYRLLYRQVHENRDLLEIASDVDVNNAQLMAKAVSTGRA